MAEIESLTRAQIEDIVDAELERRRETRGLPYKWKLEALGWMGVIVVGLGTIATFGFSGWITSEVEAETKKIISGESEVGFETLRDAVVAELDLRDTFKNDISKRVIPAGAVLIVDDPNGCPAPWKTIDDAGGRFLVGVGGQVGLTAKTYRETGGAERVKLTLDEIPKHQHPADGAVFDRYVEKFQSNGTLEDNGGGEAVTIPDNRWTGFVTTGHRVASPNGTYSTRFAGKLEQRKVDVSTDLAGGDQPHENMPPYIALYFCKKES